MIVTGSSVNFLSERHVYFTATFLDKELEVLRVLRFEVLYFCVDQVDFSLVCLAIANGREN